LIEPHLLALLILVCAATYSFEIVFGLAGTVIMLPIMGLFLDSKTLVVYSILPQFIVGGTALIKSHRKLNLPTLFSMLSLAAIGGVLGVYLFMLIPLDLFRMLLAGMITLVGIFLVIAPSFRLHPAVRRILDFFAGISHALFGISGPIVMTRLIGTFEDKTVIRNAALAFFMGLNVIRGSYYLINQTITPVIWHMFSFSAPVLIPIIFFADRLHFGLDDARFKKVIAWIILGCGILYLAH